MNDNGYTYDERVRFSCLAYHTYVGWETKFKYKRLILDLLTPAGSNNAYLVKRASGGSPQFSSDPLNLVNKNSRKVRDS